MYLCKKAELRKEVGKGWGNKSTLHLAHCCVDVPFVKRFNCQETEEVAFWTVPSLALICLRAVV